jgi:hypothetical protein
MAQRWMQAKMETAKKHGITISGCNRAMGGVMDDRPVGATKEVLLFKPVTGHLPNVIRKTNPPKAWGTTKRAKRAALSI